MFGWHAGLLFISAGDIVSTVATDTARHTDVQSNRGQSRETRRGVGGEGGAGGRERERDL